MANNNIMSMREALNYIGNACAWIADNCNDSTNQTQRYMQDIIARVKFALAAPPRNCDVGTAEEQAKRYGDYCDKYLRDDGLKPCYGCPCCGKIPFGKCEFAWSQMPYEERDKDGK